MTPSRRPSDTFDYRYDTIRAYHPHNWTLEYTDPAQIRADIRAALDDELCWLTPGRDCAHHAEYLLNEVESLRARVASLEAQLKEQTT